MFNIVSCTFAANCPFPGVAKATTKAAWDFESAFDSRRHIGSCTSDGVLRAFNFV